MIIIYKITVFAFNFILMKKQILIIALIFIVINCIAQKDTTIIKKTINTESKLDEIITSVNKIQAIIQTNQSVEEQINKLNKQLKDISIYTDTLRDQLIKAETKNTSLQTEFNNIKIYKKIVEKTVTLLLNEHASFNPAIIKELNDLSKSTPFANVEILQEFIRFRNGLDTVKTYLATTAYDSVENLKHLNRLGVLKKETGVLKFVNLESDFDNYINLINTYCIVTKKIGDFITKSVGQKEIRKPQLLDFKKNINFQNYGFLISQIDIARENPNYKFTFKANCTD